MHVWMLVLLAWLVAQPLAAVLIGGLCSGGRREKRVAESVLPVESADERQAVQALAG
jgi:hypothetical protein